MTCTKDILDATASHAHSIDFVQMPHLTEDVNAHERVRVGEQLETLGVRTRHCLLVLSLFVLCGEFHLIALFIRLLGRRLLLGHFVCVLKRFLSHKIVKK